MNQDWIPLVSRKESLLWVSLVCLGGQPTFFKRALGWDYSIKNYKYENGTHAIHAIDATQLHELVSSHGDLTFFKDYLQGCRDASTRLDSISQSFASFDDSTLTSLSPVHLHKWFDQFTDAVCQAMPFLASLVLVQDHLEHVIREKLAFEFGCSPGEPQITKYLSTALVSPRDTNVIAEYRSLLSLASLFQQAGVTPSELRNEALDLSARNVERKAVTEHIRDHVRKYGWLRTFTYLGEPFSESDIRSRLATALETSTPEDKLSEHEKRSSEDRHRSERSIDAVNDPRLQELLRLACEYLYWRFERIDVHFRAEVRTRPLQRAIASSLDLSREHLVYCTVNEISDGLSAARNMPTCDAIKRRIVEGFNYYVDNGETKVAVDTTHPASATRSTSANPGDMLSGFTACSGQAEGIARVIRSASEVERVNDAEILVTTMTTPDLMLAIERCSAIVTDEGGLLCHAAIISRELRLPCVIGTEGATQQLADGMRVRIDAQEDGNGFIHVISSNHNGERH